MEASFDLVDPETSKYLKFVISLTDTCSDTCSILEKRQISTTMDLDKYDQECLQACTKSYLLTAPKFAEKFGAIFLKGNPYLGPSGYGVLTPGGAGEIRTENADGRLE